MKEPRGDELVRRYVARYGNVPDCEITEEMVLQHWELEKALTQELLESTPENRWEVFERCYTALYGELQWLNERTRVGTASTPSALRYADWLAMIGPSARRIYEIGSGKGDMIKYLASCGYECKGAEITSERGEKHVGDVANLSWGITDGIHLDRFEDPNAWDAVITNQVIEHFHPDDVLEHFASAYCILRSGGRYIGCTPHRAVGPSDLSAVFNYEVASGMHLKEYTNSEIASLLRKAGFRRVAAPLMTPQKLQKLFRLKKGRPRLSRAYVYYLRMLETIVDLLPRQRYKRQAARLLKPLMFKSSVWLVAEKN